ncbi:ribonuclease H-like domain-containing protein [Tanacetum coccineum]
MVENPNGSNLLQQDLEKIHEDDLEAMDLKWQLSPLSMRAKRYFQRIGKKIFINANDTAGYDKSKVECFNCHKMGHFARECRAPRNKKGQFKYQDNTRKQGNNEDTSSKAMLVIDGVVDASRSVKQALKLIEPFGFQSKAIIVNTASSYELDSPKDMFKLGASHTLEATHVEFFSDEDEPEVDLGNSTYLPIQFQPTPKLQGNVEETFAIQTPKVWKLVDLPNGKRAIEQNGSSEQEMSVYWLCGRKLMKDKFQISSIGELTFFLGLQDMKFYNWRFVSFWGNRLIFMEWLPAKKLIQMVKIRTDQNVADLFTKGFDAGRESKRGRDTKIPQSSGPPIKVGDEAVHKELGDRMERAATTASSLEAEQDSGNINRTQSMATLNGSSP